MSEDTLRSVEIVRIERGRYRATNPAGATLEYGGGGAEGVFSPVELLLTAIAGCTGADVDYITSRRAEPTRFALRMSGHKVRDESGNHVSDLVLELDIAFAAGEAGDAARSVLPRAVQQSHDRLCTVSRTVELGTAISVQLDAAPDQPGHG